MAAVLPRLAPRADRPLPDFAALEPSVVEPAIDAALAQARERIDTLLADAEAFHWDNLVLPLEAELEHLARVWAPVRHLHAVVASPELRTAYNACLAKLSAFHTELGQDQRLFDAYRAIAASPAYDRLDATQRKAIDDALRDFRLSGVALAEPQRSRFAAIEAELAQLQSRFEDNLQDATHAWRYAVEREEDLSGLGPDARAMARQAAAREGYDGWLLTLEFPLVHAVLTTADDRALRERVYHAWTTRASDQGEHDRAWDNGPTMARIHALRQEKAALLGYDSYAALALETRMVERPDEVLTFLGDLAGRALPAARGEFDELAAFAAERYGLATLQPWDVGYIAEKLRQARYALSDDQLRPYFPAPRVIDGLFALTGELFGISFEPLETVSVWHPDVTYYRVLDENGEEIGGIFFDLYARQNKRGGAWHDDCARRLRVGDGVQLPVSFLTCNLMPPVDGHAAQFTHDEVLTLFHEFGHALHHLLTRVEVPSLSGINGVEWDAVELPSQLLENWCWTDAGLARISAHVDTGEPLPAEWRERLRASRHFQAALRLLRQIEFALFDFRLHLTPAALDEADIRGLLDEVRAQVAIIQPPAYNRFPHGFRHIFAGAYAAGYYSYLWAEVLSADAFAAFADAGVLDPAVGRRFREAVLERGGSRPMRDSFRAFRGRDPDPEALLRQAGLVA